MTKNEYDVLVEKISNIDNITMLYSDTIGNDYGDGIIPMIFKNNVTHNGYRVLISEKPNIDYYFKCENVCFQCFDSYYIDNDNNYVYDGVCDFMCVDIIEHEILSSVCTFIKMCINECENDGVFSELIE